MPPRQGGRLLHSGRRVLHRTGQLLHGGRPVRPRAHQPLPVVPRLLADTRQLLLLGRRIRPSARRLLPSGGQLRQNGCQLLASGSSVRHRGCHLPHPNRRAGHGGRPLLHSGRRVGHHGAPTPPSRPPRSPRAPAALSRWLTGLLTPVDLSTRQDTVSSGEDAGSITSGSVSTAAVPAHRSRRVRRSATGPIFAFPRLRRSRNPGLDRAGPSFGTQCGAPVAALVRPPERSLV